MSRGARLRPEVTGDSRLARARERFLTAEPIEPGQVRDTILASWRRSRAWHVAADRIDLSYVRDPDLDTPLTRNALPVLQNLHENLQGQPVSVILTDAHGVALSRLTADHDLERHLMRIGEDHADRASATPRSSSAPTGSAPRWRAARRRTYSGTSTTPSTLRISPAPRCRSVTRSRARPSAP